MKASFETRVCAWSGAAALILTVGLMARRPSGGVRVPASEELRDAVASPALTPGARLMPPTGFFVRPSLRAEKASVSARLSRFADALDAKAQSLRRPVLR